MKRITLSIDIDFTPDFWALLPAINLNFHASQFEFEWLCFGIYARKLANRESDFVYNEIKARQVMSKIMEGKEWT